MKIALICGGPSLERGISLNSARSVADHLEGDGIELLPIYFDYKKRPYEISRAQLYSNTPSDFDFKLQQTAKKLSSVALKRLLKSADLAFPVMHGQFGEDGGIQRLLERWKVPYVGAPVEACKRCFDKHEANEFIMNHGFYGLPSMVLKIHKKNQLNEVKSFFKKHAIKRAVVKPATGGSSIGVFSVDTPEEALKAAHTLFGKRMDTRVVIEPFCEGTEFTVIILENRFGMPVAVLPTEIETDYTDHQVFDFRKKYLPTRQVRYHCPPRFDNETIERIQVQAEQLFKLLGLRDFARFDGFLLPDGKLWFSDFNPISGMEQNSFLFQQAARIGLSHRDLLRLVVRHACERYGILFPESQVTSKKVKKPVHVLFGGRTAERQVSLMSGTNAWLKLRRSEKYDPRPFLLDLDHRVWELPYALTLNHTVEEILDNCLHAEKDEERLRFLVEKVRLRLALPEEAFTEPFFVPRPMNLSQFIKSSSFVFIGLHGGIGEDGTLQTMLDKAGVPYNGPGPETSKICMDKWKTGEALKGMESEGIFIAPKKSFHLKELVSLSKGQVEKLWKNLQKELKAMTLIVKPQSEGCSAGVVRLSSEKDLHTYIHFAHQNESFIPVGHFKYQNGIIEMPLDPIEKLLFEPFIVTDTIRVKGNQLKWIRKTGWIEVTVGVIEEKGKVRSLSPSLTVASGAVLSVEEKFQGGTGINITPPSEKLVPKPILEKVKQRVQKVAEGLGIRGYSRMDTFVQVDTGEIIVIEVNTAPALTPSTVLYHQALAETRPKFPLELLELLIENKT